MNITTCYFDDLPEWVDKSLLSNNGSGKEYATYIVIEDGDYRAVHSDAMEPEDARFGRALKWIVAELYRAAGLRSESAEPSTASVASGSEPKRTTQKTEQQPTSATTTWVLPASRRNGS